MRLGRVIGNIVSIIKHEKLTGIKLLIVEPVGPDGKKNARPIIVADYLNSGTGSLVYWIEDGVTICKWMGLRSIPLRGSIIGQVDKVDFESQDKILEG